VTVAEGVVGCDGVADDVTVADNMAVDAVNDRVGVAKKVGVFEVVTVCVGVV
jgi:hypothetical protein